jgi:hypothetical protein
MGHIDFNDIANGLLTEKARHIAQMVKDVSGGKLELRRIPENDPAFRPPKVFGVWEFNVASDQTPWVFTLMEMSIDERVIARIIENDFKRQGASERFAKLMAVEQAEKASSLKKYADKQAERKEEMLAIGKMSQYKSQFTHVINGEKVIIGDTIRSPRKTV